MFCTKMRRMLITSSLMNLDTGEETPNGAQWVTRECGIPMFVDEEKERGTCRGCFNGWTHPLNFPVDIEEPAKD
jgi:hypothetical protein